MKAPGAVPDAAETARIPAIPAPAPASASWASRARASAASRAVVASARAWTRADLTQVQAELNEARVARLAAEEALRALEIPYRRTLAELAARAWTVSSRPPRA
jgi:hypothetical protein